MSIEIQKAQKAMAAELSASEKRLAKARKGLEAAQLAVNTAQAAFETASKAESDVAQEFQALSQKYKQFLELFPLEDTKPQTKPAKAKKPEKSTTTMIEKILMVMGDRTMGAVDIAHELVERGLSPDTNNLKSYIHTLLGTQTLKARDADGNLMRDPSTNELIRVMQFRKVSRGKYCVNKVDPSYAVKVTGKDTEVVLVASTQSPADALFASQGLDVATLAPFVSTAS